MPKIKFIKTVTRHYPPLYASLIHAGLRKSLRWESFLGFKYAVKHFQWVDGVVYYTKYHLVDFPKKVTQKLFADKDFFDRIKKESLKREKNLIQSIDKDFDSFCSAYFNYMPALGLFFICDDFIEKKLRELLLKKLNQKQVDELMHCLNIPYRDNFVNQEKIDLLKAKNLDEHIRKYSWLHSRYGTIRSYPKEKVKKLLTSLKKENFLEKDKQGKIRIRKAIQKAKGLLGKKNSHIVDVMQFFIYYRTQRTDIMNMVAYKYADKLKELAKRKNLSYKELLFCSHREIKHKLPSKSVIRARQKGFSLVGGGNNYRIYAGKEHNKLKKEYNKVSKELKNIKTIKGSIACKGKVKGEVGLIKNLNDLSKIGTGNILVTSMTTTEMILAMEKASAFVTDEGGITCHAAIVSREMNKPCIIGTKVATKILRDGDKVEVDADKGVVRILK